MVRDVIGAATQVTARTVIDPRAGYHYAASLASRLRRLQRGLAVRALIPSSGTPGASTDGSNVRSFVS